MQKSEKKLDCMTSMVIGLRFSALKMKPGKPDPTERATRVSVTSVKSSLHLIAYMYV